jgi:threonine/homoserine/homoserine lactone efflux protein
VNFILLFLMGLGTGLSGAMIPGPLFLFTVSEAVKKDAAVGLRIAVGHILIEAVFVVLIFLGFKGFLSSPGFMRVVSGLGAAAFIVMGVILLKGVSRMTLQVKDGLEFDYGSMVGGAFFSIISPGFLIWWTTIGFSVVLKSLVFGVAGLVTAAAGHWVADIGWHWFVSVVVNRGRHYLKDGPYHAMVRWLALGLIVTGVYFGFGILS